MSLELHKSAWSRSELSEILIGGSGNGGVGVASALVNTATLTRFPVGSIPSHPRVLQSSTHCSVYP